MEEVAEVPDMIFGAGMMMGGQAAAPDTNIVLNPRFENWTVSTVPDNWLDILFTPTAGNYMEENANGILISRGDGTGNVGPVTRPTIVNGINYKVVVDLFSIDPGTQLKVKDQSGNLTGIDLTMTSAGVFEDTSVGGGTTTNMWVYLNGGSGTAVVRSVRLEVDE